MDVDYGEDDDSDGWIAVSHSEDEMSEDNGDEDDEDAQQLKGLLSIKFCFCTKIPSFARVYLAKISLNKVV